MSTSSNRLLALSLRSLALAGGLSAAHVLRNRFQRSRTFVPDRYPNGIWNPGPLGLPAEDTWFRSADGEELHGWWVPHRRARGTLLYCHGNSGSVAHQIAALRFLRRMKVNLFAFDYRGYGRSSGTPTEAGLYRDVQAAFDHLVDYRGVLPREIVVFGHSLGGAVAVDCAVHRPAAGLVVQSTFTHTKDTARALYPRLPMHWIARRQFRSVDKVAGLSLPKLFTHGDADGTVPFALGERLFEAAAEPKEFYRVKRAGHNDVFNHGGFLYLRRLARFRDRCLQSAAAAA